MKILFAPDWRAGNAYQVLLAEALGREGVPVEFLSDYHRVLPLWRGVRKNPCDVLHLHWPEAYFTGRTPLQGFCRSLRFAFDLGLATRGLPLVLTAHNLVAHDRAREKLARFNARFSLKHAAAVIAHSAAAKERIVESVHVPPEKCHVIPHGDPAVHLGVPLDQAEARRALGLEEEGRLCLMFGTVKPYKGIEEILDFWRRERPEATLAITGAAESPDYERALFEAAASTPNVITRFEWLDDRNLALWLSAADCAIFNYSKILTSGAACLARSWGLPVLIPSRLDTVDLAEPSPFVHRFDKGDFPQRLNAVLRTRPDYGAAAPWREKTSWQAVAQATARVYEEVRR